MMPFALFGLGFFLGGILGVIGMALSAAAKNADEHWDAFRAGYRSAFEHQAQLSDLPAPPGANGLWD